MLFSHHTISALRIHGLIFFKQIKTLQITWGPHQAQNTSLSYTDSVNGGDVVTASVVRSRNRGAQFFGRFITILYGRYGRSRIFSLM